MEESSLEEDSRHVYDQETFPKFNEENTYNQQYQSSFKPDQGSSDKSKNRTSSKKEFQMSGKQTKKQKQEGGPNS